MTRYRTSSPTPMPGPYGRVRARRDLGRRRVAVVVAALLVLVTTWMSVPARADDPTAPAPATQPSSGGGGTGSGGSDAGSSGATPTTRSGSSGDSSGTSGKDPNGSSGSSTSKPKGSVSKGSSGTSPGDTTSSKPTVEDLRGAKAEVQRLENEVKKADADYQTRLKDLDNAEIQLADVEGRKADLEKWVDQDRQELRRLAVNNYKYGSSDVGSVASLGGTGDLAQVTLGLRYLKMAQVRASQAVSRLSGNVRALAAAQRRLSDVRAARDRLNAQIEATREELETKIAAQMALVEKWAKDLGADPSFAPIVNGLRKGKLTPPPDLAIYSNGQIPDTALEYIGIGSHRLWGPAARAYRRMVWDAYAEGVYIGITDSYRPLDVQYDLARRKGLYSQGGLAATPGTSNHGWGLATDLVLNDQALQWMRANAGRYGFVEAVPRETWHWEFRAY